MPETASTTINTRGIHARLTARVMAPMSCSPHLTAFRSPTCRQCLGKLATVVTPNRCRQNLCSAKYVNLNARKRSSGALRCGQHIATAYRATRPVTGGKSASVTIPGLAATTAGTALVTGIAV